MPLNLQRQPLVRTGLSLRERTQGARAVLPLADSEEPSPWPEPEAGIETDPYPDYALGLTVEGGILITYKTLDERLRHRVAGGFLWICASALDGWVLLGHAPGVSLWIKLVCVIAALLINRVIVSKPIQIYRTVEIRSDRMILDGEVAFFLRHMQGVWPSFDSGSLGYALTGIYGTRFVEYLSLPAFDEFDRAPQVFAQHLEYAMQQMWTRASGDPAAAPAPRPARRNAS